MSIFRRIFCFIFRHDMVSVGNIDNGYSMFGEYHCLRCGKIYSWQYDK